MELEIWHIWFMLAVGSFIVEIAISSFYAVCFGAASLLAGIMAYSGMGIQFQLFVLLLTTSIGIYFVRPMIQKNLLSKSYQPTKSIIGKEAYVIEDINPLQNKGRVIINGQSKRATTTGITNISEGSFVQIVDISSNTLIVSLK